MWWESTDASWRIHQYVRETKSEKKRGRGREGEGVRQEEGKRGRE